MIGIKRTCDFQQPWLSSEISSIRRTKANEIDVACQFIK
jgi:hypothetical protein